MGQGPYPLSANFLKYFDVSVASTEAQKSEVYGIRYSVYCDEFAYEPACQFPDHEEKDEFDATSLHALMTHKSSGLPAGCVRLVAPTGVEGLDCSQQERRTFALIAVAGFLAATSLTVITNRTNVFAMMEPFLPRLLKRSGIVFRRAGSDIDYHGQRAPYFIATQSALDNMRPDLRDLYSQIHERITRDFPG